MAEAMFRHQITNHTPSPDCVIDSAATGPWHIGELPHLGTRQTLDYHQIPWQGIVSRQIDPDEINQWDYILVMDRQNLADVMSLSRNPRATIQLVLDYHPDPSLIEVPDPYNNGRFEEVYTLLEPALREFREHLGALAE